MIKKIDCIIRPAKLEDIKDALSKINVEGMTITTVKGFGRQKGYAKGAMKGAQKAQFVDKILVSIVTGEDNVEKVIEVVQTLANTGKIGDGKIFVSPVEDVIRIRTKERGYRAIE